jgi:hypothetical protein
MYSTLSTSGDKIQFTYKSQSFSIENVGSSFKLITPENPSGTLYIEGESVVYGDLKFVFGSVEIIKLIRPTPISVNFNTVIDACGNVTVFGAEAIAPSGELVVAEYEIPVTCLYTKNASGQDVSGLIEFWETSASHGSINCKLAQSIQGVSGDYYKDTAKLFATEMHKVFCNAFDCSSALPFSAYKSQSQEYWKHRDFGRLALSAHAHDLFGHVAATAAITNDTQFMQSMLSLSKPDGVKADGTVIQRTQDWSGNLVVQDLSGTTWSKNSATDANLALRMVWAILSKGLNANGTVKTEQDVYNATTNGSDTLSAIVRQVLGQDASRTMDVDNNELLPELHQLLRFYPGDTIYMNVKLQKPNVSYGTNPQGRPLGPFQDGDQERNFVVRVKLREPTAPPQF